MVSKIGFKWKTLSNDPNTGKRAQIMQLNRPANAPEFDKVHRKMEPGVEPVTIKAGMIIGLTTDHKAAHHLPEDAHKPKVAVVSCLIGSLKHAKEAS